MLTVDNHKVVFFQQIKVLVLYVGIFLNMGKVYGPWPDLPA